MSELRKNQLRFVLREGIEPSRPFRTVAFEATAYTNSATKAKQEPLQRLRRLFPQTRRVS